MVKYHPDTRFLTDYAAGTLPEAQALCVATHLHYCRDCRRKVSELTTLGEVLFSSQAPLPVQAGAFDTLMARIDKSEDTPAQVAARTEPDTTALPGLIAGLATGDLESLRWHKVGKSFRYSRINSKHDPREASLLHIRAGGSVPHHQHRGDEITVVLQGSFSDQEDRYHVGDFVVRSAGERHRPVASQDEDCLCLATLDAPIRMSNPLLRMVMPFMEPRAN